MPNLTPTFNWGSNIKNINDTLYNQLSDSYSSTARIVNTKASKNVTTGSPAASSSNNSNYDVGDIWIDTATNTAWIMTSRSTNSDVTWTQIT